MPSGGLQASILHLLAVLRDWHVPDHLSQTRLRGSSANGRWARGLLQRREPLPAKKNTSAYIPPFVVIVFIIIVIITIIKPLSNQDSFVAPLLLLPSSFY